MLAAILLLSLSCFFWTGDAAECTDAEVATAALVWDRAAGATACTPYVVQTDPVYINAPCTASGCVSVVEDVAQTLPDCTSSGQNHKVKVVNALKTCNIGITEKADSSTAATDSTPNSRTSNFSSSSAASSSILRPAPTLQSTSCTTAETKNLWYLYVTTATSDACASESDINGGNIEIITQCDSSCTESIRDLVDELPNCVYEYENLNKKQNVLKQLNECDRNASSISIALFPNNADIISSSSRSGALQVSEITSGSNAKNSPSDNAMESLNVENSSNVVLSRSDKLQILISFMAAIVVAVMGYY